MRSRWIGVRILVVVVLTGCVVSRAPRPGERPSWRNAGISAWENGCALGEAWVRKSGKEGFGVAVQLKSRVDCRVQIAGGKLVFDRGGSIAVPPVAAFDLKGRSLVYAWVPVRFDNDAAWDDDRNIATLELAMIANDAPSTFSIKVRQR